MRNGPWANVLVAAFCVLCAGSVGAQQTDPAKLDRVEVTGKTGEVSKWFRAESPHFVVFSDAEQDDVTQLLGNLEKLDHLLRIYTQPIRQAGPKEQKEQKEPKLTLYYRSRTSDLREIGGGVPSDAVGLYSSCASGVEGFAVHLGRVTSLSDQQLDKSALNDTLSYAFEAYARHFLYRHTDIRIPASFIDGFAQYFSSVRFSESEMVVGRIPRAVAHYLKFLDEGRHYSLDYDDVLQGNLANAHNYAGDDGVRLEFEAKSWLLMHYMLSSEDKRKRLNRYLALIDRGASPTIAFERAFGVKTSDMGTVMWRYSLRGVEALRVAYPSLPAARVNFHTMPLAAGEFVIADAALRSCPDRQAGEALLKKVSALAARFPDDDLGRLTLSRAQIDWGNPQDAMPRLNAALNAAPNAALNAAAKGDDADFEARYLLGMANLRLAERTEGDAGRSYLEAARRHLQQARELRPESSEAAFAAFRAEVAATDQPGGAALQGVISTWLTAREVDTLGRSAALAYAYAGNADEAYRTLASLAQDVRDERTARWAKLWQSRLETGVTRGDILAEMRRNPAPDASFKEWTIDKDSVMKRVELNYGLQAAQSFIQDLQNQQNRETPSANGMGGSAGTK
ncbi:MAG TPA: hypothetical protein VGM81_20155 [Burkholderiaceae bacterium]|jgi:tetratricopeptide (TPR) repeat protein